MRKRKPCLPISNSWEEYKKRKSRKKRLLYIQELICISALVYLYNRSAIRLRAYVTFLFFLFQSLLNIHCTYIYIYIYIFFLFVLLSTYCGKQVRGGVVRVVVRMMVRPVVVVVVVRRLLRVLC